MLVSASILIGCGTTGQGQQALPLSNTFAAVEITSDGRPIGIPTDGLTEVDINSTIGLTMKQPEIAAATAGHALPSDDAGPSIANLTDALAKMDGLTKAQLASTAKLRSLALRLTAGDKIPVADINELGRLESKVVDAARAYAAAVGMSAAPLFAKKGYEAINVERSRLLARVQAQRDAQPNLRWRMEATSTRAGPIHLVNYDDLPQGDPRFVNKLDLSVSDDAKKQLEAARVLSADLNKLIAEKGSLQQALEAKVDEAAVAVVERAVTALDEWTKADLAKLTEVAAAVRQAVAADPDVQKVENNLKDLKKGAQALWDTCRPALTTVQASIRARTFSLADLDGLTACGKSLADSGPVLADDIQSLVSAANGLLEKARKAEAPAKLKGVVGKLETVVQVQQDFTRAKGALTDALDALDIKKKVATPVWRSDHFQDRPLQQAADTALEIQRIDRQAGDQLFVRPSLIRDGAPVMVGSFKALQVVKAGARIDVSGAVTFLHPTSLRDGEQKFRATPVVTAALHYRTWRNSQKNTGWPIWNFVDPGIGLHVAYPDMGKTTIDSATGMIVADDPSAEIGIGGVVQLFGDLLQAGYGYDLQVSRGYWYIGFGLQSLTRLGISRPTGATPKAP